MKANEKSTLGTIQGYDPAGRRQPAQRPGPGLAKRILFSISFESRRARVILVAIIILVACLASFKISWLAH